MKRIVIRVATCLATSLVLALLPSGASKASEAPVELQLTQLITDELNLSIMYVDGSDAATEPRQSTVKCSTRAYNAFHGTRDRSGVVSGEWHTRYHTGDCEVSGYDQEMSYMNVTHDTSRASGGFWTSQISQCEGYQSGLCTGVTGSGSPIACGACNDSWTLTLHYTLIMPDSGGRWQAKSNPPGTSGGCTISSSGKRIDCSYSKSVPIS